MGSLPMEALEGGYIDLTSSSSSSISVSFPLVERKGNAIDRSPVESPPLIKKQLRFSQEMNPSKFLTKAFEGYSSCLGIRPNSPLKGQENRSILKRTDSFTKGKKGNGVAADKVDLTTTPKGKRGSWLERMDSLTRGRKGSELGRSDSIRGKKGERRVNFEQTVSVIHFDRFEGDHVLSECKQLNPEPEKKKNLIAQILRRRLSMNGGGGGGGATSPPVTVKGNCSDHVTTVTFFNRDSLDGNSRNVSLGLLSTSDPEAPLPDIIKTPHPDVRSPRLPVLPIDGIEYSYVFNDDDQSLRLRFIVPLGNEVIAGDILVKANMTGNRVRVIGRRRTIDGSSETEEINERYSLPVNVDSYRITARLDTNGMLIVEAPLLSSSSSATTTTTTTNQSIHQNTLPPLERNVT